MIGKISGIIIIISLIFAIITGSTGEVAKAAVEGAGRAVTLTVSLCGMMCLWCGVMNVAKEGGALSVLSKIMSPFLRLLFPDAWRKKHGIEEISASISANILGIGNAATPLAINAMQALADNNNSDRTASADMVTFTVLGTASVNIVPTTIITLRSAAGSANPFETVVPIWICSVISAASAVIFARLGYCATAGKRAKRKKTKI